MTASKIKTLNLVFILLHMVAAEDSCPCRNMVKFQQQCEEGYALMSKLHKSLACLCICEKHFDVLYPSEPPKAYSWYRTCANKFFVDVSNSKRFRGKTGGVAYYIGSDGSNLPLIERKRLYDINQPLLTHSLMLPVTEDVVFIPDFHFISYDGYQDMIEVFERYNQHHSFESKHPTIFWRGSPTNRIRHECANKSLSLPQMNVGLSSMKHGNFSEQVLGGIYKEAVNEYGWIKHRGIMDMDGHVNAWGLYWRLASRSVVFKVESNFTNSYIRHMRENVHYLRIEEDLSNLATVTSIITSTNPADIEWMESMTRKAFSLAMNATYPKEVLRVASDVTSIFGRNMLSMER